MNTNHGRCLTLLLEDEEQEQGRVDGLRPLDASMPDDCRVSDPFAGGARIVFR